MRAILLSLFAFANLHSAVWTRDIVDPTVWRFTDGGMQRTLAIQEIAVIGGPLCIEEVAVGSKKFKISYDYAGELSGSIVVNKSSWQDGGLPQDTVREVLYFPLDDKGGVSLPFGRGFLYARKAEISYAVKTQFMALTK